MEVPILLQVLLVFLGILLTCIGTLVSIQFKKISSSVEDMSKSIIEMNTNLTVVITQHNNTESIAKSNLSDIIKLRERLHSLEGRDSQILSFIEEYSKGRYNE